MTGRIWMIDNAGCGDVLGDPTAASVMDAASNTVYEICNPTDTPSTLNHATHVITLSVKDCETMLATGGTSTYYALMQTIQAGTLQTAFSGRGYGAVLYDNENWPPTGANGNVSMTRMQQAQNPVPWYQMAGRIIKGLGLTAIASPARDLANLLQPYPTGEDAGTEASNIYGLVSPFFDIIDVQAQDDQPSFGGGYSLPATAFNSFVSTCLPQITGTAGHGQPICGLAVHSADAGDSSFWQTTKGSGWPAGHLQAMMAATAATAISNGAVGWWMNPNGVSNACVAAVQALAGV